MGQMSSSLILSYHNLYCNTFKNLDLKNNRIKSYKNLFYFEKKLLLNKYIFYLPNSFMQNYRNSKFRIIFKETIVY